MLTTVIAGPYTGTYDPPGVNGPTNVGQTQDGFNLNLQYALQPVTSNAYGDSVVDAVYRGGNCFLNWVGVEENLLDLSEILSPYTSADPQIIDGIMGQVGRLVLGSSLAGATVLTVVSGTTAASAGPASLTASNSILAPNHQLQYGMASRARLVPIILQCFPYTSTGDRWFSVT